MLLPPLSAIGMRLMWMGEENGFYVGGGAAWSGETIKLIVVRYIGMQTAARRRPALVVPIYETNTIHYLCNHTCFAGGGAWWV